MLIDYIESEFKLIDDIQMDRWMDGWMNIPLKCCDVTGGRDPYINIIFDITTYHIHTHTYNVHIYYLCTH